MPHHLLRKLAPDWSRRLRHYVIHQEPERRWVERLGLGALRVEALQARPPELALAEEHLLKAGPELGGGVGEQALRHVGVRLRQDLVLSIGGERQALQHREGPQDEGVVGWEDMPMRTANHSRVS